jgi:hypothetical protein
MEGKMDFGAMFQTWVNVLTHPNEQTFIDEQNKPQAKLSTALIWIVIAAIIVAIFSIFRVLIGAAIGGPGMFEQLATQFDLPPELAEQMVQQASAGIVSGIITGFCGALIAVPLGFLIGSGLYWLIAKLLGGTGSYEGQTYLMATYTAPLMIINGIVTVIPIAGGCLAFIIGIYNLVLTYFALKVSHDFTSGKAITTLLIPVLIGILLGCCIIAAVFTLVGAAVGGSSGGF